MGGILPQRIRDEESELISSILETKQFKTSGSCSRLLIYLFDNRERFVTSDQILLHVLGNPAGNLGTERRVRERTKVARRFLREIAAATDTRLVCVLPEAVRGSGYRLEFKLRDAEATTLSFWKPHLDEGDVYIVYVEQLFYQNWPRRYALRDPALNANSDGVALDEFRKKYAKPISTKKGRGNKPAEELVIAHPEEITVAHPYVNYGDIMARDYIARWFDQVANIKVENAISRRMEEAKVWDSSAILFGDSRNNSMMQEVLQDIGPLDIKLEAIESQGCWISRARVSNPSESERSRGTGLNRIDLPNGYALNYDPGSGDVLALVTRVRNRKTGKTVTMFCAEVGRAIQHLGQLFVEDDRLQKFIEKVGWQSGVPSEFQILFLFRFGSLSASYKMCEPEAIAWRPHTD
jgi:hypothetical protein